MAYSELPFAMVVMSMTGISSASERKRFSLSRSASIASLSGVMSMLHPTMPSITPSRSNSGVFTIVCHLRSPSFDLVIKRSVSTCSPEASTRSSSSSGSAPVPGKTSSSDLPMNFSAEMPIKSA